MDDVTCTTTVDTPVLLGFEGAREGRDYGGVLQGVCRGWSGGRETGSFGEEVDETKNEVAGECTAQVGDTRFVSLLMMVKCVMTKRTLQA